MKNLIDTLDNLPVGTKVKITVGNSSLSPLLGKNDFLFIVTTTDMADESVELLCIRHSLCLARITYANGILTVTDIVNGSTKNFTDEQAEALPVSILGDALGISFS